MVTDLNEADTGVYSTRAGVVSVASAMPQASSSGPQAGAVPAVPELASSTSNEHSTKRVPASCSLPPRLARIRSRLTLVYETLKLALLTRMALAVPSGVGSLP